MISVNNKLILEPYKGDGKIKASVNSGFAQIKQKSTLIGLKVLADASINAANSSFEITKGSTVYIEEEVLHTQDWSKRTYETEDIDGKFIMVDYHYIRIVKGQ